MTFRSLEPSLQTKWRLDEVWVCEAFPFASPTKMGRSQIWPPLQDFSWKTEGNNGLWKYFAVQKSSFLWLFRKDLTSQNLYRVGQIYFIEGFIL